MIYIHLERLNPLTKKRYPKDSVAAHIYVNPASIAKIQGQDTETSLLFYVDAESDPDLVLGFAPDVARMLEDEDNPVAAALDSIDTSLGAIVTAIDAIDCAR